jgi:predicted RNA-binding Zn-ribbon protein involved in translation (DUF1610 family)
VSNRLACRKCGFEAPAKQFDRHGLKWRCPDCRSLRVDRADQDDDPDA